MALCSVAATGISWAAPSGFSGVACDAGGSADHCTLTGSTWICDVGKNGTSTQADAQIIHVPVGFSLCDGDRYCAFGQNAMGDKFYCTITDTSIRGVRLVGADYVGTSCNTGLAVQETLSTYYSESGTTYSLDSHSSGTLVNGVLEGQAGCDLLNGNDVASSDYREEIHGGDDDDVVSGNGGNDHIFGEAGADVIGGDAGDDSIYGGGDDDDLDGGAGDDLINGGTGDDVITGGAGNDTVFAGDGDDLVAGGGGVDGLNGGLGDDIMCGDAGVDNLFGNDGDDVLWRGTDSSGAWPVVAGETNDGHAHSSGDVCDDNGPTPGAGNTGCETQTSSMPRPTSCP